MIQNSQNIISEEDLVSIILPTFNRGKKCINVIKTVMEQTYKNIELIIINDGSDEENSLIIENYLNEIRLSININYIKQNNKGTSESLNVGLDNAKGDYITWISDDNFIYPNFIEVLAKQKADFSYSNYNLLYSNSTKSPVHNNHSDIKKLINHFRGMASFMWKKDIIKKIGYFNTDLTGLCDDYDYEIRTFLVTKNIKHIDEFLIDFYIGSDTQSTKNNKLMKETHLILKDFYNIYIDKLHNNENFIISTTDKEDKKIFKDYHRTYSKINICNIEKFYFNKEILFISKKYEILINNVIKNKKLIINDFN